MDSLRVLTVAALLAGALAAQSPPWTGPYNFWGPPTRFNEIAHACMIGKPGEHQGKVLLWRATDTNNDLWLWDPAAPTGVSPAKLDGLPIDQLFCAGHTWDKDGDLVLGGGQREPPCGLVEPNWSWRFDSVSLNWLKVGDMLKDPSILPIDPFGHYYPSLITLFNGFVLSVAGTTSPWDQSTCGPAPLYRESNEFQWFNKASLTWQGTTASLAFPGLTPSSGTVSIYGFKQYPLIHLLHSGHVYCSVHTNGGYDGNSGQNRHYSPSAICPATTWPPTTSAWQWTVEPYANRKTKGAGLTVNLRYPTGVLKPYRVVNGQWTPDEVVVIGGYDDQPAPPPRDAEKLVWSISSPHLATSAWSPAVYPAMASQRIYANAVLLPDLSVCVVGGATTDFVPYGGTNETQPVPVYTPELLDFLAPAPTWQAQPPHQSARLYHFTGVLLPDGRVGCFGGYKKDINKSLPRSDCEVFSPPYLQSGLLRPTIASAPSTVQYGQVATVTVDVNGEEAPDFATLIRCGSVTHHFDWDQRCIRLELTDQGGGQYSFTLPADNATARGHYLAPPGYYMLFVVSQPAGDPPLRVPSVARFVKVL